VAAGRVKLYQRGSGIGGFCQPAATQIAELKIEFGEVGDAPEFMSEVVFLVR
jgi:hypothetical protein